MKLKQKKFIGITIEIINERIVYANASTGESMTDKTGIDSLNLIEFFHELAVNYKTVNPVFCCYAFSKDAEFIFKDLSNDLKDELFQSHTVRKEITELEEHKADLLDLQYNQSIELDEADTITLYNQIAEVNKILGLAGKITYKGYKITLMQGKQLIIKKDSIAFTLYDLFGFFRKPLSESVSLHLKEQSEFLTENKSNDLQIRQTQSLLDCYYIAKLGNYIYTEFGKIGIQLSRFHGSSVITSAVLSKAKAREEYRNFKTKRSLSPEAQKAVNQSFYGARVEQLKLGKFENVNVYDLNSAYAKAALYLPPMIRKPIFSKEWKAEPFSVWHIDYELPKNVYYGLLPNRDTHFTTRYKRRGRGYFWQPEIVFLMQNYPNCFKINQGFYVPYKQANFTRAIRELYETRKVLKLAGNPLEKIIKLALATIYGKFCQRVGFAYWFNQHYAGFITSFVRADLLQATKGFENKTICFLTDAIHTTAKLPVSVSDEIGEFRHKQYDNGVYLGAGIYQLKNERTNEIKEAKRGFTELDFGKAIAELKEHGAFSAFQDYFVGHNLHSLAPTEFNEYLKPQRKKVKVAPFESKARMFEKMKADFRAENTDSTLFDSFSGRESAEYTPSERNDFNFMFDAILAGKK